jgi:sulfoquinovosidase
MLTYINPYLTNDDPTSSNPGDDRRFLFAEAAELGYLVLNGSGEPYIQSCGSKGFTFGTVDLTNPDAKQWYAQEVIAKNMLGEGGVRGWMADFAEYLPFDSLLSRGDPYETHNAFPKLWAETNQVISTNDSPLIFR